MKGLYRTTAGAAVVVTSASEDWVILDVEGATSPVQSISVEFFDELILDGHLVAADGVSAPVNR